MSVTEILIVEDDEVITSTLAYNLSRQGFGVKAATTGAEALRIARKMRPDLILLDVMLPGESGIEVCERIRERDQDVVIVMVTAKDAEEDKVRGFEAGADDYVTKPFSMKELVARINANLKRSEAGQRGKVIEAGDLQLDTKNFTAHVGGEPLDLRLKEFELLVALASAPGELKSREELAKEVWGHAGGLLAHHRRPHTQDPRGAGGEILLPVHPHSQGPRLPLRGEEPGRGKRRVGNAVLKRREDADYVSPDEMRRVNKIRRDFVANVSHELKTPATSLRLLAESLQETIDEDPVQARLFAAQLKKETERLSHLITDLLDLTRLRARRGSRTPSPSTCAAC